MKELAKAFIVDTGGVETMSEHELFRWIAMKVGYEYNHTHLTESSDLSQSWAELDDYMYNKLVKPSVS